MKTVLRCVSAVVHLIATEFDEHGEIINEFPLTKQPLKMFRARTPDLFAEGERLIAEATKAQG